MILDNQILEAEIDSLSHDARGVARVDGKVFFIDQALPGEWVRFQRGKKRRSHETGKVVEVLRRSKQRTLPACEYFGVCGGCALQHLSPAAQISSKQKQLRDNLERIAKTEPERYDPPLTGPHWGYRRKARLGVRYVPKKGGVLIGFRERNKSYITPLYHCDVLAPRLSALLPSLKTLLEQLSCFDRIPQIEVASADNATALVLRHLVDLAQSDLDRLSSYAASNDIQVFLQPKGLDSVFPLYPSNPEDLFYRLSDHDITIYFNATDFVQINDELNRKLVDTALEYLDPCPDETILDLFCGLGNFTLPLARKANKVVGLEGDKALVQRARMNSARNGINNAQFLNIDLYRNTAEKSWPYLKSDKVLLDPPRTGAIDVVKSLDQLSSGRVVYISCNPATLARDAEVMVHKLGYTLRTARVVDMFPHTTHVESIAVFDRY